MFCLICGRTFKRLSTIIQHYNKNHDYEDKMLYYSSYYGYSLTDFKNDYVISGKGLKTISVDSKIPYRVLKEMAMYLGVLRTSTEAIRLQNSKNEEVFMSRYGVRNPFQIRDIVHRIQEKNKLNKDAINASRSQAVMKRYGVNNVSRIPEVKEKNKEFAIQNAQIRSDRMIKSWSDVNKREQYRIQIRKGVLEKYGVTSVFALPQIQSKIEETLLNKYGTRNIASSEHKRRIMIQKGYWVDENERSDFENYKLKVYTETRKWSKRLIEGWMLFIGKCYYTGEILYWDKGRSLQPSIDHKTSIIYGFKNNIPPGVIGGSKNLCVCSCSFNAKKNSMTEEELYKSKHAKLTLMSLFD